ncbi:tRNA (adenosine(37)-N6)-threonylcarbamoyltransferase complex dimerization subunit type 1 TsaB [Megalodesulfovibrio paquesii]
MRPLLALNCAEDRLQLALGVYASDHLHLLAAQEWTAPGKANPLLAPAVQAMLRACGLRPGDLAGIACVTGPGSFTSLRLVLSFAEGLRLSASLPLAGLEYPALLARAARERLGHDRLPLLFCTHARKGLCYARLFAADSPPLPDASAIQVLPIHEALALAADLPTLLCGSALRPACFPPERLAGFLAAHPACTLLPERFDHPDAATLLAAAAGADFLHTPLAPIYLRPSDAEANLEAIAQAKGLDPAEARAALTRLTAAGV